MNPRPLVIWSSFGGLVLSLALAAPRDAQAQEASAPAPAPVSFEVNVCLASQDGAGVDPECRSLQDQLPVRFSTLKVQRRETFEVSFGQPMDVSLPTGSHVQFRPISIVQERLHVQVEMPGVVNTRVQLRSGRSVILGGVRHRTGNLIIELRPTFVAPLPEPGSVLVEDSRPRTRTPEVRRVGARRSAP